MAIVKTVPMKKGEARMRVNQEEVANYTAQGWEADGGGDTLKLDSAQVDAELEKAEPIMASTPEELVDGGEPEAPEAIKMTKEGSETLAAPDQVEALKVQGWIVAE